MDLFEFLNEIKEKLKDKNVNFEELNDIEKARTIYIKLGEEFYYDEQYYTGDSATKKEIVDKGVKDIVDDKVVCSSINKIYAELLNMCDINAKSIHKDTGKFYGHDFTEIEIDDSKYSTDLIHDLKYIKMGNKTKNFMNNSEYPNKTINEDKLHEIDDKIGYTYGKMYNDEVISMLKNEIDSIFDDNDFKGKELRKDLGIENYDSFELIKYISNFILKNCSVENKKYCIEKSDCFFEILKSIMPKTLIKDFSVASYSFIDSIEDQNKLNKFFFIEQKNLKENNYLIYKFSDEETGKMITKKDILKQVDNGLKPLGRHGEEKIEELREEEKDKNYENLLDKSLIKETIKTTLSVINGDDIKRVQDKIKYISEKQKENDGITK